MGKNAKFQVKEKWQRKKIQSQWEKVKLEYLQQTITQQEVAQLTVMLFKQK